MPDVLSKSRSRGTETVATANPSPQLNALLVYLASERGLAQNSLHAYRRDLQDLESFLELRKLTLATAAADDFRVLHPAAIARPVEESRTLSRA